MGTHAVMNYAHTHTREHTHTRPHTHTHTSRTQALRAHTHTHTHERMRTCANDMLCHWHFLLCVFFCDPPPRSHLAIMHPPMNAGATIALDGPADARSGSVPPSPADELGQNAKLTAVAAGTPNAGKTVTFAAQDPAPTPAPADQAPVAAPLLSVSAAAWQQKQLLGHFAVDPEAQAAAATWQRLTTAVAAPTQVPASASLSDDTRFPPPPTAEALQRPASSVQTPPPEKKSAVAALAMIQFHGRTKMISMVLMISMVRSTAEI